MKMHNNEQKAKVPKWRSLTVMNTVSIVIP